MCKTHQRISCEVSYLPLNSKTTEHIDKILNLITNSGIEYEIGYYRTILRGDMTEILNLIKNLYVKADSFGDFVLDVRFSNTCGY